MRLIVFCFVLFTSWAIAADSRYFPLHLGNLWVYEVAGSSCCEPLILEVADTATFNGQNYFLLSSSTGGKSWLRSADDGQVFAYDPQAKQDALRYNFAANEDQLSWTPISDCCGQGTVAENAVYSGPVGLFVNAVRVTYPSAIGTGVAQEIFAPGVGLVRRIENTGSSGLAFYQLIYARVGGTTFRAAPTPTSGITGRIFRGPVCPVQPSNDPACADQPFQTAVTIQTLDGRELTTTASDGNGYFRVLLPSGDYMLTFKNGFVSKFPRSLSKIVTVPADGFASVTIRIDTGIR